MDTFKVVLKCVELLAQQSRKSDSTEMNAVNTDRSFESEASSNDSLVKKSGHLESQQKRTIEINIKSEKNFEENDNVTRTRAHFVTKYRFRPAAAFQTNSDAGTDYSEIWRGPSKDLLSAKATIPEKIKKFSRGVQTNLTRVEPVRNRFFERHLLSVVPSIYTDFSDTELNIEDEKSTQTNEIYVNSPTQSTTSPQILQKLRKPKRRVTWRKKTQSLFKNLHSANNSEEIKSMKPFENANSLESANMPSLESREEIEILNELFICDDILLQEVEESAEPSTGHLVKTEKNEINSLFLDESSEEDFKSVASFEKENSFELQKTPSREENKINETPKELIIDDDIRLEKVEELAGPSTRGLIKKEKYTELTNKDQEPQIEKEKSIEITDEFFRADDIALEDLGASTRPPIEHSSCSTKIEPERPRAIDLFSKDKSEEVLKSIKSFEKDNSSDLQNTSSREENKINETIKEFVIDDDNLLNKVEELAGPSTGGLIKKEKYTELTNKDQEPQIEEEKSIEITDEFFRADDIALEDLGASTRPPIEHSSCSTKMETERQRAIDLFSKDKSEGELKSIKPFEKDNSSDLQKTTSREENKINETPKEFVIGDDILLNKVEELAGPSTGGLIKKERSKASYFPDKTEKYTELENKHQETQIEEEKSIEITDEFFTADDIALEDLGSSTRPSIEHSSCSTRMESERQRAIGLFSKDKSGEELKSIKSFEKDNSFELQKTSSREENKINKTPKELVIDDDILLEKVEELAGPSTGGLIKKERSKASYFPDKAEKYTELTNKEQKPQIEEEKSIKISKEFLIVDDISLEELGESIRPTIMDSSVSTKMGTELKKTEQISQIEEDKLIEISKEILIADDILSEKLGEQTGSSAKYSMEHKNNKTNSFSKNTENNTDRMNIKIEEENQIENPNEIVIENKILSKGVGEDAGPSLGLLMVHERSKEKFVPNTTEKYTEPTIVEQMSPLEEEDSIGTSKELFVSNNILTEEVGEPAGPKIERSMTHNKSKPNLSSENFKKYTDLTKTEQKIQEVDKNLSEQKYSHSIRSHSKSTSKGFLVPLAREQSLENYSSSNETNVLIDVSNIYVQQQRSENKNVENVGNETKTLRQAPEDAINQIKHECWNNELLILIIPHNCDTFDEAELLEVHTIDRIYKLHIGSFCFPKSQLANLEKGGIFQKYFAFLSSNKLNIDNELESIIRHTRYLIDRGCFCEIKNIPKNSAPNVTEIFKKYNGLRVRSDELGEIFKLAEKRNFKIYARPDYRSTEHAYILDFFTENSNYLGTVSATNKNILKELKIYQQIVKNVNVIFDVNELVLPNGLRQVLFDVADTFGVMYLYDRLGIFLFEMYKRFS